MPLDMDNIEEASSAARAVHEAAKALNAAMHRAADGGVQTDLRVVDASTMRVRYAMVSASTMLVFDGAI